MYHGHRHRSPVPLGGGDDGNECWVSGPSSMLQLGATILGHCYCFPKRPSLLRALLSLLSYISENVCFRCFDPLDHVIGAVILISPSLSLRLQATLRGLVIRHMMEAPLPVVPAIVFGYTSPTYLFLSLGSKWPAGHESRTTWI